MKRGPYVRGRGRTIGAVARPSQALAANLRLFRGLRQMTQDELAARMTDLGHGWGRSTVSAVEGNGRNVTVDELFGLALCIGVTIGELLDPTGPDRSRDVSLDVGVSVADGCPQPMAPALAQLWSRSRAVVRLWRVEGRAVEFDVADDLPTTAQHALEALRAGVRPGSA